MAVNSQIGVLVEMKSFKTEVECSSCVALWHEYSESMSAHMEAVEELEVARLLGETCRATRLERVVAFAERLREGSWLAAIAHEDDHRERAAA